ncbi:MAG: alpha-mannosidase [Ilumatobacteraceae bacterium]
MAHRVTSPAMQRAQRLLAQRVRPMIHVEPRSIDVEAVDESFEPLDFSSAIVAPRQRIAPGQAWGRAWHTTWFRLSTTVSAEHDGRPLVALIDIGFNGRYDGFQAEAIAWMDGRIVHAIQPDRRTIDLGVGRVGTSVEIWIEAAATPVIAGHASGYGPTPFGDPRTAPSTALYSLRRADICVVNTEVERLALELHNAIDITLDMEENDPNRSRHFQALDAAGRALAPGDVAGTATEARLCLAPLFDSSGPRPRHRIVATGHAHLDTAWLWPIRETRRKAVRTFANAVHLLKVNPDAVFAHSQAQHYEWVREDAPDVFAEVARLVSEGRWEPVGGMWVETDLNLPSGESLLRQMVHGQRAFVEWFGERCTGAFLPDDFGYPGSLPQIVRHGGGRWFFTQKLSWNETNRMPHHSFWWEGIDGSRVFTHFSPIDTYNALMTPSQLRFAERNFADHAGATMSLVLYGHGDGGGGPTQHMIDRARLARAMDSVPSVSFGTVEGFFAEAEDEYGPIAPTWVGEMYFEKHRGTYSTQIGTKQGNRNSERLLHEIELWSSLARHRPSMLDEWWKRVLTQQFHDIIPGSSIAWVHRDAEDEHAAIAAEIEEEIDNVLGPRLDGATWIMNPAPVDCSGVIDVDGVPRWVEVPAFGSARVVADADIPRPAVTARQTSTGLEVDNGVLRVAWDASGSLISMIESNSGRELMSKGDGAGLIIRRDTPAEYDAWDIDMADADADFTKIDAISAPRLESEHDLRVVVAADFAIGTSRFTMRWSVVADSRRVDVSLEADWREPEHRVQLRVPVDVFARDAVCGTQFGHVRRGRHSNTSWDLARFESCAHRYVHIGEPGVGFSLMADGPRGYDVRGNELRMTLLRAPLFPDPMADRGRQRLEWAYLVTLGDPIADGSLEREASRIAHPPRILRGTPMATTPPVRWESSGSLVSALKLADDGSNDLIVRLWETRGGRTSGRLTMTEPAVEIIDCDALETPLSGALVVGSGTDATIDLRPFQIRTLRVRR